MDTTTMIIVAVMILGGIAGLYLFSYFKEKKSLRQSNEKDNTKTTLPLKLQAYERLVLLADPSSVLDRQVRVVSARGGTARRGRHGSYLGRRRGSPRRRGLRCARASRWIRSERKDR